MCPMGWYLGMSFSRIKQKQLMTFCRTVYSLNQGSLKREGKSYLIFLRALLKFILSSHSIELQAWTKIMALTTNVTGK